MILKYTWVNVEDSKNWKYFRKEINMLFRDYARYKEEKVLSILYGHCKYYYNTIRNTYVFKKNTIPSSDDVFHDIFLKLIDKVDEYNPAFEFTTWFTNMIRFHLLETYSKYKKHYSRYINIDELNNIPFIETEYNIHYNEYKNNQLGEYLMDLSDELLKTIDPIHKKIFFDVVYIDMDYSEVAKKYKTNVNTIKSRIRQTRLKLCKKRETILIKIETDIENQYVYTGNL